MTAAAATAAVGAVIDHSPGCGPQPCLDKNLEKAYFSALTSYGVSLFEVDLVGLA